MEERKVNWGQILVSALVTGIVAIITGTILFRLQTREPKLVYQASATSPFRGSDQNFAIYDVEISNRGSASIHDVTALVEVPSSEIEDYRISADPTLRTSETDSDGGLEIRVPELNPGEQVGISVLATSDEDLPTRPDISVRGSGVLGEEASEEVSVSGLLSSERLVSLATAVAAAYTGLATLLVFRRRVQTLSVFGRDIALSDKHSDDQNEILAYLCGIHGLADDMQDYLARPRKTSYWAEADRHAALAESDPTSPEAESRKHVLADLLEYASVAPLSRSIVQFDIARIANAQGNQTEAEEYLAKIGNNPIIKSRLRLHADLAELTRDVGNT